MRSACIWAVALTATLSLACNDTGNINDNTAAGTDRTGTSTADRSPGDAARPGTAGSAQATRDPGTAATMARASNADDDRAFVEKMARVNMTEVKLGQLAAERGSNAQVKQYGRRMSTDHQKANAELKQVASKIAVQMPTDLDAKHQDLVDRLSKMKGAEFDREYMQAMADGHQEVVQELERHADRGAERGVGTAGGATQGQTSVNEYAKKMLPDVRQHLDQAKQIHAKLDQK